MCIMDNSCTSFHFNWIKCIFRELENFEIMNYTIISRIILFYRRSKMEYLTVKELGDKWGITSRMVNVYCSKGRIPGAIKKGNLWLVPSDAVKPEDQRRKGK